MPDPHPEIRRLTEDAAAEFWALRLRALRDHPEAFGRSYEESLLVPAAAVSPQFRAEWTLPHGVMLGAMAGGLLVGIVGVRLLEPEPQRHKATIRSVYVAPEHRGRGLARSLLEAAIAQATVMPGLEQLQLTVGTERAAARRLYASLGFESFGVERRALKHGDRYVDEEHIVLFLDGVPGTAPAGGAE